MPTQKKIKISLWVLLVIGTMQAFGTDIAITNSNIFFSPGGWYSNGTGAMQSNNVKASSTFARSISPGNYIKFNVTTAANESVSLVLDISSMNGQSGVKLPQLAWSLDGGPLSTSQLPNTGSGSYVLTLHAAPTAGTHSYKVWYKSRDLNNNVVDPWNTPVNAVTIKAVRIGSGSSIAAPTLKSKRAFFYGDSQTEGANVLGTALTVSDNDATQTWNKFFADSIDIEYGVAAFGGQGYVNVYGGGNTVPDVLNSYNLFSAGLPRTFFGSLDYCFVCHGSNGGPNSIATIQGFINSLRTFLGPCSKIVMVVPMTQGSRSQTTAAVANVADSNTKVIDTGIKLFTPLTPTIYSFDAYPIGGGHPNALGNFTFASQLLPKFNSAFPASPLTLSIAGSSTSICSGQSVTFSATPVNGGSSPSYQWKVNGSNVGSNSATYSSSAITNGQVVTCVITTNTVCPNSATATSNSVAVTVNTSVVPALNLNTMQLAICSGTTIAFTATPTNGGSTPFYQWKVNGSNVGSNSSTYSSSSLTNGAVVNCVLTSNASCSSPTTATSNSFTIAVTPTVTPSISVSAGQTTICSGTTISFTATPNNGGTTPTYQWKVNGSNIGSNSSTYSSSTLTNGSVVKCVLTSNAVCSSTTTATSNSFTIAVTPTVTPSVNVSAGQTTICSGTTIAFTAAPGNGGTTPSYQWKVNGSNVGSNSSTYSSGALTNGAIVKCVLTSNAVCSSTTTATSNSFTITVTPTVTPSINVSVGQTTICSGTTIAFTATPNNGGTTPIYQWKVNGSNVGSNSSAYSSSTLTNGSVVKCVLTSNAVCSSTTTATSNSFTITVTPTVTPSINVSAGQTTICSGTTITFTATPTNGGTTPAYQWKVNGNNVGNNSPTYSSNAITNGQIVTCVITSNAVCANPTVGTSNSIAMTVNSTVVPSLSINAPQTTICSGTTIAFAATPTNGGTAPTYQWKVNGSNVGSNSNTFSSATLTNGAIVTCVLTSNATCLSSATTTSNSFTIAVTAIVTPSINISTGQAMICSGTTSMFTATPTNGGTTPVYQWIVNGSNVGSNSAAYSASLANGDLVSCMMTSNAACASPVTTVSSSITMSVNPIPASPVITQSVSTLESTAAIGYQWYLNGTLINGAIGQTYVFSQNGNYTVEITDVNGCKSLSVPFVVNSTGVRSINDPQHEVLMYPNPANERISFAFQLDEQPTSILIFNTVGELVINRNIGEHQGEGLITLDIHHLPAGMYVANILTGNQSSTKKLIIE